MGEAHRHHAIRSHSSPLKHTVAVAYIAAMGVPRWSWPADEPDWLIVLDWSTLAFVVVVFAISFAQIRRHKHKPVHESMQWNYILIIGLRAITSLLSWFTLFFPHLDRFFEVGVVIYHCLAVVAFFHILVEFSGGFGTFTQTLKARNAPLAILPFPCTCLRTTNHEAQMARWRNCVYQVWAQSFWALLYAVLVELDHADKFYLSGVIHLIMFCHVAVAMFVLLAMYMDCGEEEFQGLDMEKKFIALKLIVYLQILSKTTCAFVFGGDKGDEGDGQERTWNGFTPREYTTRMLSRLILLQMLLFAIWFMWVFSEDDPALQLGIQTKTDDSKVTESLVPVQGTEAKDAMAERDS